MADFCAQCSVEIFGEDFGDLKGIAARKLTDAERAEGYGWTALCEGCGAILVDDEGRCVVDCLRHHNPDHPTGGRKR